MAKNAKEYIGIDFSDVAISDLNKKLSKENCESATAVAIDFLSRSFKKPILTSFMPMAFCIILKILMFWFLN